MADDAADLKIRISTTADLAGADAATQSVEGLTGRTESLGEAGHHAAKGIDRMVEEAGTVREAQRVASGFFDTFEGGGRTVQGVAEIMRFFLATAVDLDPMVATLLILGASLTTVIARHKDAGDAAKDHASTEKEAADEIASAHETFTQEFVGQIDQIVKAQEISNAAQREELNIIREKQALAKEQLKIDEKTAEQTLRRQYLIDQQNPALSDTEKKRLRERYEAGVKDIHDQTTVNTAEQNVTDKEQDYNQKSAAAQQLEGQINTNQDMVDGAMDLQRQARETLEGMGLKPNDKGELIDQNDINAAERLKEGVSDAQAMLQAALHPAVQNVGTAGAYVPDVDPTDVARRQRDLRVAQGNYDAFTSAQQNYNVGDEAAKKIGPQIEKDKDDLSKAANDLRNTLAQWLQAQQEVRQAKTDRTQDRDQSTIDEGADAKADATAKTKAEYDTREAKRKADIELLEKQAAAPGITPDARNALQQQIDQKTIAGYQDDLKTNGSTMTDAQRIELRGHIKASQAGEGNQALAAQMRDQKIQLEDQKKQIEELKKELRARPDHQSLEPYIKTADALDAVHEIPLLQSDLAQNVGAFVTQMTAKVTKLQGDIGQAKRDIQDMKHHINQVDNRG